MENRIWCKKSHFWQCPAGWISENWGSNCEKLWETQWQYVSNKHPLALEKEYIRLRTEVKSWEDSVCENIHNEGHVSHFSVTLECHAPPSPWWTWCEPHKKFHSVKGHSNGLIHHRELYSIRQWQAQDFNKRLFWEQPSALAGEPVQRSSCGIISMSA